MENITQRSITYIEEICKKYKINHMINKNVYMDTFWIIKSDEIGKIRKNYKVIDVNCLDPVNVNYEMFADKYFDSDSGKEKQLIVNNMVDYYLSHKDKPIYKKTDYLCNKKEQICICNTHAHDFRKIYSGINYKPDDNYISWIKKTNEPY